jgi:hypothetical protein
MRGCSKSPSFSTLTFVKVEQFLWDRILILCILKKAVEIRTRIGREEVL